MELPINYCAEAIFADAPYRLVLHAYSSSEAKRFAIGQFEQGAQKVVFHRWQYRQDNYFKREATSPENVNTIAI